MSADPACRAPVPPEGAVPRTCVPFAHVPAVPAVMVPYVPVPVPSGLPVLSVAGILPDRTGNVDVTRFLEEWAAGTLADKADKAVPLAAGNLASLDASGNLLDSGATPASIKAAAVAEVVANAPGTMDTLKEIADILGSSQQSGTVLKRISDLETGKADSSSLAAVATSGSYDDLLGKPTIPAPVSVDATLTVQDAAADAKAVGDVLRSGFTKWEFSGELNNQSVQSLEWSDENERWECVVLFGSSEVYVYPDGNKDATRLSLLETDIDITATRHLITPTKTSQMENDGDGTNAFVKTNDTRLSDARTPTAHHVTHAANGSDPLAPADIGAASLADLPYRLVTPGEWEYSGVPSGYLIVGQPFWNGGYYDVPWRTEDGSDGGDAPLMYNGSVAPQNATSGTCTIGGATVTATFKIVFLDRAVNAVPVTAATTLTLPEKIDGKSRDFYVRLTVSAESAVTFAATDSGGDAVSWDSMGSPSGTFAAGTYLYRFTEVAAGVFHAADVTNGGSVDPAVLAGKLEATSAAPAFDQTLTYIVGEYVTYGGILYRCKTAVTVAGAWTGDSNWVDVDMTSPDATLDIRSDGRLAVVAADGEILWIQGYDMASASDVELSCEKVNLYAFASGTTTQAFNMPSAPGGKVGDFVLDIDNSANASTAATATLNGFGTSFDVIVPKGQNLFTDILTFEGGEMCELYFTMTAFGTAAKPAWKVVKQVVEKQEAGS